MVKTNPKIGRVYPHKTMLEEGYVGPDPQFTNSFLAIRSMVEELYKEFRKHKDEMYQAPNKIKEKKSLSSMTTQKEKGKKKAFSHLLIALNIKRRHL